MSTSCTYDLTELRREVTSQGEFWVSEETSSRYDANGKVISGPAVADLPYYEMKLDVSKIGGPPDTLYVIIGSERSPDWRFTIPSEITRNAELQSDLPK